MCKKFVYVYLKHILSFIIFFLDYSTIFYFFCLRLQSDMCIDIAPCERNWRLYHLLDVGHPITSRQIKWNFRKVTLRHHYQQAYHVLYNRHRKHLYDVAGEDAYGFISSGTWGPFIPTFGCLLSIVIYCLTLLAAVALLIVFFALLAVRVDGRTSISWMRVAIPLLIFVCGMVIVTFFAILINFCSPHTYRECMSFFHRISPVGNFIAAALYCAFAFVIAAKVRTDPGAHVGSYMRFFAFLIVADSIYYLTSLIWRWPRWVRMNM